MNVSFLADAGTSSAQAPATTVAINILWFLSLVFSLAAASIGISAKQWLSHYVVPETVIAIQRLRIWHLRYQRFREWHVPQIIEALPFLLQLSLALFLVGVAVLLWSLHLLVGIIVTIPTGVLLLFTLGTWITPAWVPGCPYKSPQARWVYRLFRRLSWNDGIIHREDTEGRLSYLSRITQAAPPVRDWLAREEDWIHSVSVPFAVASTDVAVAVDRVLQKDDFLQEAILPAVARVDAVTACNVVNDVVCSRAHIASLAQLYDTSANGAVAWFYDAVNIKTIMVLGDLAMNTLPAVSKHSYDPPALALAYRPNGQTRVQGLLALLNHVLRAIPVGERQTHCHRLAEWFVRNEIHLLDRRTFPQTHEIALWLISVHWMDFTHACPHELRAKFLDLVVEMLDSWMQGYRRVDKSARLEARDLAREQKIWDLYGLM
ncbi:hypothetical protein EVJ58_g4131 [Rhodofomes roseus]|nr:hypothetical protein EVJ58_g4131 [Rhodofomes roseus]